MKRGPSCSVCSHPKRETIDASGGMRLESVAKRFGVSKSALDRHRKHAAAVAPKTRTVPPPPTTEREALLDALAKAKQGLSRTETDDLPRLLTAINAISKRLAALDEDREVTGEQITASSWWQRFEAIFVEALRAYPDAARAVMKAIEEAA
jgi:hypothetical protein